MDGIGSIFPTREIPKKIPKKYHQNHNKTPSWETQKISCDEGNKANTCTAHFQAVVDRHLEAKINKNSPSKQFRHIFKKK
jgi:hypothetical protein